jgi:hypothetical protein
MLQMRASAADTVNSAEQKAAELHDKASDKAGEVRKDAVPLSSTIRGTCLQLHMVRVCTSGNLQQGLCRLQPGS